MAKIYETKADLERDRLKEIRREAETDKRFQGRELISGLVLGTFGFAYEKMEKFQDEVTKIPRTGFFSRNINKIIGYTGFITAALSLFEYISKNKEQHKAELELARLGPEQVVLPPEMSGPSAQQVCTPCVKKLLSGGARSVLEQGARTDDAASLAK